MFCISVVPGIEVEVVEPRWFVGLHMELHIWPVPWEVAVVWPLSSDSEPIPGWWEGRVMHKHRSKPCAGVSLERDLWRELYDEEDTWQAVRPAGQNADALWCTSLYVILCTCSNVHVRAMSIFIYTCIPNNHASIGTFIRLVDTLDV